MTEIIAINAREILDSRGFPTVEAEVTLFSGATGRASVPSGASTGEHEALELRDGNKKRYLGKGVERAVKNVMEKIAPEIIGMDALDQRAIDYRMIALDGSDGKKNLGANAILSVSLAIANAAAQAVEMSLYRYIGGVIAKDLPVPMMNVINGGKHADNNIDLQEFMIVPAGAPNFREALRMAAEVFHTLKSLLQSRGCSTAVGDEGGFALILSITKKPYHSSVKPLSKPIIAPAKIYISPLMQLPHRFIMRAFICSRRKKAAKSAEEMVRYYKGLVSKYPIISLEDGLAEDDWEGWQHLTETLGGKIQLVGDDIFVTNRKRLERGILEGVANSILIKLNQIGTLTETLETIQTAKEAGYTTIVSHRSGETEDTTMADVAVAANCGQIKSGSLSRSERLAKYNRLLRIEEELGEVAVFRGLGAFYSINRVT